MEILEHRAQMGMMTIPYIAKGNVFRVSHNTKRLKERILQINPFKNSVCLSLTDKEIDEKFSLNQIEKVEEVQEKGWLMKEEISYFKLFFRKEEKPLMLAVNHDNIC